MKPLARRLAPLMSRLFSGALKRNRLSGQKKSL